MVTYYVAIRAKLKNVGIVNFWCLKRKSQRLNKINKSVFKRAPSANMGWRIVGLLKYIMQKSDKIWNDLCDSHKGRPNLHNHRSRPEKMKYVI